MAHAFCAFVVNWFAFHGSLVPSAIMHVLTVGWSILHLRVGEGCWVVFTWCPCLELQAPCLKAERIVFIDPTGLVCWHIQSSQSIAGCSVCFWAISLCVDGLGHSELILFNFFPDSSVTRLAVGTFAVVLQPEVCLTLVPGAVSHRFYFSFWPHHQDLGAGRNPRDHSGKYPACSLSMNRGKQGGLCSPLSIERGMALAVLRPLGAWNLQQPAFSEHLAIQRFIKSRRMPMSSSF